MAESKPNSPVAFQRLDELAATLKVQVDEWYTNLQNGNVKIAKTVTDSSSSPPPQKEVAVDPDVNETLMNLFILLFEFTEYGQVQVASKCGDSLVKLLYLNDDLLSTPEHIESVKQSLLCISAICNYSEARCKLFDTTPVLKLCIDAVVILKKKGNDSEMVSFRDKFLSCMSTLIRGHVLEAVELGIVNPMIDLLSNETVVTDLLGSLVIILSLIEPNKRKDIGARVLLSGVVPMLFRTLAKPVPDDATATERVQYRNLQIVGLRCVACVLRHQKLARESASQFFATEEGESHLKCVVEYAEEISNVSHWIFATEILVWLGTVDSCQGLLGRIGAKKALYKVASKADPYGKWKTLTNQVVSAKVFPNLWITSSVFEREQHAFLAFWMNRYACGGTDVSIDAYQVREVLCSEGWMSFATTLLASPDKVTRKHAHTALQSLRGETIGIPPRIDSASTTNKTSRSSSSNSKRSLSSSLASLLLSSYLLQPLGLESEEEKYVIDALISAKLHYHILVRPGIDVKDTCLALSKLSIGTKLAFTDGLNELRTKHSNAKEIVRKMSLGVTAKASELPTLHKPQKVVKDEGEESLPECFISYCWAQKDKAKALKHSLEDHGVNCWMDEQQMEGGSMLFQEIDEGISASEVVVSCLSPEYANSVNCNREVLLAADRKKATIPVLLEELEQWPPRGNLGPILAGKLYIKINENAIKQRKKSPEVHQLVHSVMQLLNTKAN